MSRLILWRHGRTEWNHTHRIQGQLDTDLDEVGLAQAAAAAPGLAALDPDLIFSSDLLRTRRTAGFLADLTGLPVSLDTRLRERHFGSWQGLTGDEAQQRYPEAWAAIRRGESGGDPTVESLAELGARASAALLEIADRLGGTGTAVVVTHGGAARAGAATLLGLPEPMWRVLAALANCAVTDLRLDPHRGWTLQAHNIAPAVPG
jgi:probable phosphoglycerate mutase